MDILQFFREKGWSAAHRGDDVLVVPAVCPESSFFIRKLPGGRFLCRMENQDVFTRLEKSFSLNVLNCPPLSFRAESEFFETLFPEWLDRLNGSGPPDLELEKLADKLAACRETERTVEATQREGQAALRRYLIEKHGCRCMVCGATEPDLLVASHIKGWAECVDDAGKERLDPENVLLLAKNYDALFDRHYISFDPDTGTLIKSKRVSPQTLKSFGIPSDPTACHIEKPSARRADYLRWHIEKMEEADAQHPQIAR